MMKDNTPLLDVIVIGAGISGLSFARQAKLSGLTTLVLEKQPKVGGLLESCSTQDGFWLELGAHTCYNSYTSLLDSLESCPDFSLPVARKKLPFNFWYNEQCSTLLSQFNYFELLTHLWRFFFLKKQGKDLKTFYSALFGSGNYQKVLSPAFAAVLSQPADNYPAECLFNKRPLRQTKWPRTFSFNNGLQSIALSLASVLPLVKTKVNILSIEHHQHFSVTTDEGVFHAKQLAFATPHQQAAVLIGHVDKALENLLQQIPAAIIETLAVVYPKTKGLQKPCSGLIARDAPFYSCVSRDPIPHPQFRGMTFHFKPHQISYDEKLKIICACLGVSQTDILYQFEKIQSLPTFSLHHTALVAQIEKQLHDKPYFLLGNYFHGIAIEDCAVRAQQEFSRLLKQTF